MNLRILHRDEYLIAVDKPSGFHVHPPEGSMRRTSQGGLDRVSHRIPNMKNCLYLLRKQAGCPVYPVHRLDQATSGVLLFALQSETAREMGQQFLHRRVKKTYFAVTRGWVATEGRIDRPLKDRSPLDGGPRDRVEEWKEAVTEFNLLGKLEIPSPVGIYASARYSLVRVSPHTGRMHQIRRHFARDGHPLLGDSLYGDRQHNRFFREKIGCRDLWLKAYSLEFAHPISGTSLRIASRWNGPWHRAFELFGLCPYEPQR